MDILEFNKLVEKIITRNVLPKGSQSIFLEKEGVDLERIDVSCEVINIVDYNSGLYHRICESKETIVLIGNSSEMDTAIMNRLLSIKLTKTL
jgi:hypothetical protein